MATRIGRCRAGLLCAAMAGCAATVPPATPSAVPVVTASADPGAPYVIDGLSAAAVTTAPGQPMVVGVPVGVRGGSVVLESATLLPLPGYPLPELVGTGVVTGSAYVIAGWDWPPRTTPTPGPASLPVTPLAGYSLSAGRAAAVYYAIRASQEGVHYAAGVRLTYRSASGEHAVDLYQVGVDCVVAGFPKVDQPCAADAAATARIAALGAG